MPNESSSQIAITSLFDDFASNADLQTYLKSLRPDITGFTFNVLSIDDGQTSVADPESNALTQVAAGLASKVPMAFIVVGSETTDGPVSTFTDALSLRSILFD